MEQARAVAGYVLELAEENVRIQTENHNLKERMAQINQLSNVGLNRNQVALERREPQERHSNEVKN